MGGLKSRQELDQIYRWLNTDPVTERHLVELRAHVEALEKERDAALADNAALMKAITKETAVECGVRSIVSRAGQPLSCPDVITDDSLWCHRCRLAPIASSAHSGTALLEEHKRALVRARDEGLAEADAKILETAIPPAFLREHHPDVKEYESVMSGFAVGVNHALDTIRTMRDPK